MTEVSLPTSEREKGLRLLELTRLAASSNPTNHNSVVFVPPIEGSRPSPAALEHFREGGSDFWFTEFRKYGRTLEEYVAALQREIGEKIIGDDNTDYPFVIGYSSGCPLAADLGAILQLPRENILLVAPIYPIRTLLGRRVRAVKQRIYDAIKRTSRPEQHAGIGVNFDYIKRTTHLLKSKNPIRNYLNLRRLGTNTMSQIESGTVFTGEQDDVISPRTDHTTILVPKAGHNFEQMVPAIIQHIASKLNS